MDWLVRSAYAVDIGAEFPPAASFPTFGALVSIIVRNVIMIAGVVAFIAIIYAGLQFIHTAGDAKAQEQSKGALTASILGFIIILSAYAIVEFLQNILGIKFSF